MRSLPRVLAFLATLIAPPAFADYVIAPSGGDITGAQVSAALANGDYELAAITGDIIVNDAVNWSAHTLTLTAANVDVNAVMTASGTATLELQIGSSMNMALGPGGFTGRVDFTGAPGGNRYIVNDVLVTLIRDATALQAITGSAGLIGKYALAKDVSAGPIASFRPIGNGASPFTGTFDGLGHTVSNLAITGNADYVALFGAIGSGGVLRNLGAGGAVKGNNFVAGLVARIEPGGSVSHVYSTVNVQGSDNPIVNNIVVGNTFLGGLTGYNLGSIRNAWAGGNVTAGSGIAESVSLTGFLGGLAGANDGSLTNVYATGAVMGYVNGYHYHEVGGLVGYNDGTISGAYATGNVTGNDNVGGLTGTQATTPLAGVYATGNVTGHKPVGGLVGYNNQAAISDVYATGYVKAYDYGGGLVGINHGSLRRGYFAGDMWPCWFCGGVIATNGGRGTVENTFWNSDMLSVGYAVGEDQIYDDPRAPRRTLADLHALWNYANWDIDDAGGTGKTWRIYDGRTTPLLRPYLAPLALTPDSAAVVYDRNAHGGPGTWSATPANVDASRVLGTGLVTGSGVHAGTYPLTLNGLYSIQRGYDIAFVPGALTIGPRPLTITPEAGQQKTYGTDDPPAGFAYGQSGVLPGDDAQRIGNLGRAAGEGVGSRAYTLGNLRAGNTDYVTVFDAGAQAFTITQASVVVTPDSGQSKVEATADPVLTYTASGLAAPARPRYWAPTGSDEIAANENDRTLAGTLGRLAGEAAGDYAYTPGTLDAGTNYTIDLAANAPTFTIYAVPRVTAISPAFGPDLGGTAVTLAGTGFVDGATMVKFGATPATSVVVTSATSLAAAAPPGSVGTVDVTVTTPGGPSATSMAGRYTYRVEVIFRNGFEG